MLNVTLCCTCLPSSCLFFGIKDIFVLIWTLPDLLPAPHRDSYAAVCMLFSIYVRYKQKQVQMHGETKNTIKQKYKLAYIGYKVL